MYVLKTFTNDFVQEFDSKNVHSVHFNEQISYATKFATYVEAAIAQHQLAEWGIACFWGEM